MKPISRAVLVGLGRVGLVAVALLVAACGSSASDETSGGSLTVYSGRGEDLIGPVLDLFEDQTGITIDVRYGNSADMALQIDTEGERSPADIYIGQSPGAVGFLDQQGLLAELPADLLSRVDAAYQATSGNWVGITGRVRVLVYNTDLVDPADLPASVLELTNPEFAGRVAVAPSNGSFQDFVTGMRGMLGDDATADWLAGMAANGAPNYPKNGPIVDAVTRGEVDMGLVNHYYLLEFLEEDPSLPAANHVFGAGDIGSMLITSAAAIVGSSDNVDEAQQLIEFLLSAEAQTLSANGEKEYPLIAEVGAPAGLAPLADLASVTVDLNELADGLTGTQQLIENSGIIE